MRFLAVFVFAVILPPDALVQHQTSVVNANARQIKTSASKLLSCLALGTLEDEYQARSGIAASCL